MVERIDEDSPTNSKPRGRKLIGLLQIQLSVSRNMMKIEQASKLTLLFFLARNAPFVIPIPCSMSQQRLKEGRGYEEYRNGERLVRSHLMK